MEQSNIIDTLETYHTPGVKEAVPAKKKHLFTQDRAETKKVPVEEDGSSGATFTIGANL